MKLQVRVQTDMLMYYEYYIIDINKLISSSSSTMIKTTEEEKELCNKKKIVELKFLFVIIFTLFRGVMLKSNICK